MSKAPGRYSDGLGGVLCPFAIYHSAKGCGGAKAPARQSD